MILSNTLEHAVVVATVCHNGQTRKASDVPYIVHPYSVMIILSGYTDDESVLIAGLLHDVLEDVPVSVYDASKLKADFGGRVLAIVRELSETKTKLVDGEQVKIDWETRKKDYLLHLASASQEALMVCAADKIHNISSILEDHKQLGETVWSRFNAPKDQVVQNYLDISRIVQKRLKSKISQQLAGLCGKLQEL